MIPSCTFIPTVLAGISAHLFEISSCMKEQHLQLNLTKTELLIILPISLCCICHWIKNQIQSLMLPTEKLLSLQQLFKLLLDLWVPLVNLVWFCHHYKQGSLSLDCSHWWFHDGGTSYQMLSYVSVTDHILPLYYHLLPEDSTRGHTW